MTPQPQPLAQHLVTKVQRELAPLLISFMPLPTADQRVIRLRTQCAMDDTTPQLRHHTDGTLR